MAGFYTYGDEHLRFIKEWDFLTNLSESSVQWMLKIHLYF
jgi:hypothetical protein